MYSGERILPQKVFNVTYQQSLKAYELVREHAVGKRVLDVACGEGYGTSLLGTVASKVVGLDYNKDAVKEAQGRYGSKTVSFVHGNLFGAKDILRGEQFDIVCCFQTIEHVQDHDAFLTALAAAVHPGGLLMVSTPNKNVFPSFNPYHVHEVDYKEIDTLFAKHFSTYQIQGVFGDESVMRYRTGKQKISGLMLRLDLFHARYWLPGPLLRAIYAFVSFFLIKKLSLWKHHDDVVKVTTSNFRVGDKNVDQALDFIAIATVV